MLDCSLPAIVRTVRHPSHPSVDLGTMGDTFRDKPAFGSEILSLIERRKQQCPFSRNKEMQYAFYKAHTFSSHPLFPCE
ncbi:hypothetical protein D3C81_2181930 [compost metagenome]